jgi:hypothetical protein
LLDRLLAAFEDPHRADRYFVTAILAALLLVVTVVLLATVGA